MGERTILECVNKFTSTIVEEYGDIYLREPNVQDIARLLEVAEQRGFPGMLDSIDCMHWELNVLSVFFKHNMQLSKVLPGCGVKLTRNTLLIV
jgi:hypothetical protein